MGEVGVLCIVSICRVQMGGSKLFIDSDDDSRIFGEICDSRTVVVGSWVRLRADKSSELREEQPIDAVNVAEMMECSTCQDLDPRWLGSSLSTSSCIGWTTRGKEHHRQLSFVAMNLSPVSFITIMVLSVLYYRGLKCVNCTSQYFENHPKSLISQKNFWARANRKIWKLFIWTWNIIFRDKTV